MSGRRTHTRRQHAHRRRLARPVWAEQPEDLAALHAQVQVIDCAHAAAAAVKDLREPLGDDDIVARARARFVRLRVERHRRSLPRTAILRPRTYTPAAGPGVWSARVECERQD